MFRRAASVAVILFVALVVWLPTLGWGLPSRDADRSLFGDRKPWTGAEIIALTATSQPTAVRGADVDADPILDRSKPVLLNDTDAKRAAIVRRYRLMSGQPDEFIQFKALSEMAARPGLAKLDPRLYQYGGLWMYPVGAMVRASMLVGIIQTPPQGTPAMEFYLDHPEAFGRFYVVARFYSWCWGIVAALAIVWIARRITNSLPLATLAAVAFMLTPVVRTATHEAKPHLAGAALCLCAVIAATKYVETGRRRWALAAGALCGASMAMVVSMLLSCVVLPTMCWLRMRGIKPTRVGLDRASEGAELSTDAQRDPTPQGSVWMALLMSLAVAAIVYVATNPFVLINAIAHPEILRSNLGNSTAMYSPRSDGLQAVWSAIRIACAGVTLPGFVLSVVAISYGTAVVMRTKQITVAASLLAMASLCFATLFVLLAAGKPAEYARFGIVTVGGIAIAVVSLQTYWPINRTRVREFIVVVLIVVTVAVVVNDAVSASRKVVRQRQLEGNVGLSFEPAPWSSRALNLFDLQIYLINPRRPEHRQAMDTLVFPRNLSSQVGFESSENVDWMANRFVTVSPQEFSASSDSDPEEYPSASQTAPTSRGR